VIYYSRIVILFVSFLVLLSMAQAQRALVIDQRQALVDPDANTLAVGGQSNQVLAQVVTVGMDGRLRGVLFPIGCESGRLKIEIRNVVAGEPGPVVFARKNIRASRIATIVTPALRLFPFFGHLDFSAGDQFAIVLSNPRGSCGVAMDLTASYPGGGAFYRDDLASGWILLPVGSTDPEDLSFATLMLVR